MAKLLMLNTFSDNRGDLTVLQEEIGFIVRRLYYIYNVGSDIVRGGHRHRINKQALICISGSCKIFVNDSCAKVNYFLDQPDKCLILDPEDWHNMYEFSENAILLVLASELYDVNEYIDEPYND
jgi:dTDP-4-dehydrorhamnose 3,5-epimerase-like enzyme